MLASKLGFKSFPDRRSRSHTGSCGRCGLFRDCMRRDVKHVPMYRRSSFQSVPVFAEPWSISASISRPERIVSLFSFPVVVATPPLLALPFYFIVCVTVTFPVPRKLVRLLNRVPQTPQQEKKDKKKKLPSFCRAHDCYWIP